MAQPDPWEELVAGLLRKTGLLGAPEAATPAPDVQTPFGPVTSPGTTEAPAQPAPLPMVPKPAAPNYAPGFSQGLYNFGRALQGADIPLMERSTAARNATRDALMARGASDAEVSAALSNPVLMQSLLGSIFAPKTQKLGAGEALVTPQGREVYRNVDKFVNVPEGGTLVDPNTRQSVFGGGPKLPEIVKDYEYYKAQEAAAGRAPRSFEEWDHARKRAGATAITVDMTGEKAFAKEAASGQAKRFNELAEKSLDARNLIGDLQSLRDISARITSGKSAELQLALGPWAELFNIKIEGLGDLQAYQAIVDKMAPRMRVPGSGASSDFDARQFLRSLPQLGNTPEGRAVISNTFEAIQRSHIAAGEIASRALSGEITPKQAEQELRALPDPFELWKRARGTAPSATPGAGPTPGASGTRENPATPGTFEDALKLPKGSVFIVPDGPEKGKLKVR